SDLHHRGYHQGGAAPGQAGQGQRPDADQDRGGCHQPGNGAAAVINIPSLRPGPAVYRPGLGVLLLICGALGCSNPSAWRRSVVPAAKNPRIEVAANVVKIHDLDDATVTALDDPQFTFDQKSAILGFFVDQGTETEKASQPPILGSYGEKKGSIL